MTFVPKYVPYREAARIVVERVGLKEGQFNPLDAALSESEILPEVKRRQLKPGEWNTLEIIKDFAWARPTGREVSLQDDEVMIPMADIDRLWPPAASAVTVAADDDDYAFIRMQIEAIRHFKGKTVKKAELERYFLDKKRLPDGTPITRNLADMLATLSRSPRAMKGGNKKG